MSINSVGSGSSKIITNSGSSKKEDLFNKNPTCKKCAKTGENLLICSNCHDVSYCSKECQKADWKKHKLFCLSTKASKEKKETFKVEGKLATKTRSAFHSALSDVKPTFVDETLKSGRVFIETNESKADEVLNFLREYQSSGKLFVGIGAMCNLNLASVMKNIDRIVIMDPSELVGKFWKNLIPLITASKDRLECKNSIQMHIKKHMKDYLQPGNDIDYLTNIYIDQMESPDSWLSEDTRYMKIKKILEQGNFSFLPLNLCDAQALKKINDLLKIHKISVGAAYLSNLHEFITPGQINAYEKSLNYLLARDTIIIDTEERPFKATPYLTQCFSNKATLETYVRLPLDFNDFKNYSLPTMRVVKRKGKDISKIYPIIKLAKKNLLDQGIFFQYGLKKKYYDISEAKRVDDRLFGRTLTITQSIEEIVKELYSQQLQDSTSDAPIVNPLVSAVKLTDAKSSKPDTERDKREEFEDIQKDSLLESKSEIEESKLEKEESRLEIVNEQYSRQLQDITSHAPDCTSEAPIVNPLISSVKLTGAKSSKPDTERDKREEFEDIQKDSLLESKSGREGSKLEREESRLENEGSNTCPSIFNCFTRIKKHVGLNNMSFARVIR